VRSNPVAHRVGRHRQQPCDVDLRTALADQRDRPPAKLFLSGLRQRAGVPVHARNATRNTNYLLRRVSIEEKTRDFVGRTFVFDAFERFAAVNPRGYFFIRGDPGIGKSALMAQLVKEQACIHHFNVRAEGINRPELFLRNVCAQIVAACGLPHRALPIEADSDAGHLRALLSEATDRLGPGKRLLVVVDALDEVDEGGHTADGNTLLMPLTLPHGAYVIATARRMALRLRVDCEQETLVLVADDHVGGDALAWLAGVALGEVGVPGVGVAFVELLVVRRHVSR